MNERQRKYYKKCKRKFVRFYLTDSELLEFAERINFQSFVKKALFKAMMKEKGE